MVAIEYNKKLDIVNPFIRKEIPRHQFTFDEAVNTIIALNDEYDFDYIILDAGSGEYQYETLVKYGMEHPETGLHYKIVQVNFSEKIHTRDPHTKQKIKKDIKPFMVNNLVKLFERGQIALNPEDKDTIKQFEDYHVVRWGQDGRPIYIDENEHIHDCVMLAYHGLVLKYSNMLKTETTSYMARLEKIKQLDAPSVHRRGALEVPSRKKPSAEDGKVYVASMTRRSGGSARGMGYRGRRTL